MPRKERPDPAQVPALYGGRKRSVTMAGRDPYPSDSAAVLAQPKTQNRGQNEKPRVEYEARACRALHGLFQFTGPLKVLNTAKRFNSFYFTINGQHGKR